MFKFKLGENVKDRVTGISGIVIGRVEYLYIENNYYVRWKREDGGASEEWLPEKQIVKVEE